MVDQVDWTKKPGGGAAPQPAARLTRLVILERAIERSDFGLDLFQLEDDLEKLRAELLSGSPEVLAPAVVRALAGAAPPERAKAAEMLGALGAIGAAQALRRAPKAALAYL